MKKIILILTFIIKAAPLRGALRSRVWRPYPYPMCPTWG